MKELSIEEKAKAYDDAKLRMSAAYNSNRCTIGFMNEIFPELKESEDERIRKFIKDVLDSYGRSIKCPTKDILLYERAIAWLEKQGNLMKALQISNAKIGELIEKNYYLKEQLEKQGNNMGISEATKQKLEDNLNKALEKKTPESWNKFLDEQGEPQKHDVCDNCEQQGSCVFPCPMKLVEKQGEPTDINPSEFDLRLNKLLKQFETLPKEELASSLSFYLNVVQNDGTYKDKEKQGGQKPVFEMKTPEESLGIDSDTYNKIVDECIYGEQKPIKEHNACEFCEDRYGCVSPCSMKLIEKEKHADEIKPKFKVGQTIKKEGFNLGFTIVKIEDGFYYNDIGDYFPFTDQDNWELVEQNPAWSEEDIELLDNTIKFIEDRVAATSPSLRTYSPTLTGKEIPFLKALKDRVQPQKQEWSDADKDILFRTINNLKFLRDTISIDPKYAINIIDIEREINWLESLKDRYVWKPSDEQMLAINTAINVLGKGTINGKHLIELQKLLKKLREKLL